MPPTGSDRREQTGADHGRVQTVREEASNAEREPAENADAHQGGADALVTRQHQASERVEKQDEG